MTIALDKSIDTILATRKLFIKLIESLSIDQLNNVPEGFNNNIIWNFAHVVVTQQIICYKLSGLPLKIDEKYVPLYSKATKPESFVDENEVAYFKQQAMSLVDEWVADVEKNIFGNFKPYTTSFNVELTGINDALKFITMHEGLHLGYAMALKRVVSKIETKS
ncbi:MAG: DinB family protein [Ferruginibacter sp.]